jgi:hypothetical protein
MEGGAEASRGDVAGLLEQRGREAEDAAALGRRRSQDHATAVEEEEAAGSGGLGRWRRSSAIAGESRGAGRESLGVEEMTMQCRIVYLWRAPVQLPNPTLSVLLLCMCEYNCYEQYLFL